MEPKVDGSRDSYLIIDDTCVSVALILRQDTTRHCQSDFLLAPLLIKRRFISDQMDEFFMRLIAKT